MSNGTFLQQLECGYRFPALIHVWIASAGVLELFISTSGEATSACKPFWHNGWGNSGMNECRKSIPTQELLQENHSLVFDVIQILGKKKTHLTIILR